MGKGTTLTTGEQVLWRRSDTGRRQQEAASLDSR